jgi:hypothetical protein
MATIYWRIEHSPVVNGNYPTTNVLTTYRDILVNTAMGNSKDSFKFKVDNLNGVFDTTFSPNDKITVYRKVNTDTGWSSGDILMTGVIRDVPETSTHNKEEVEIKGYNFSESVARSLVFVDGTTGTLNVPQFLEACTNSVKNFNTNFSVTWDSNNPTVKTDSTTFPTVNEYAFYRPLSFLMEKFSGSSYTEDVNYYWYVDKDNNLVWKPKDSTNSDIFDESADSHVSLKVSRDTKDVKNYIIVKGGLDPRGNPIQDYYGDYNSIGTNGFKYHFLVDENKMAQSLLDLDRADAGVTNMEDATYPFFPRWADGSSYVDFDAYVAAFRVLIKSYSRSLGQSFAEQNANGKIKTTIDFNAGTKDWNIGDLIACNISKIGTETKSLRVDSAQYGQSKDTFVLIEDKGTQ